MNAGKFEVLAKANLKPCVCRTKKALSQTLYEMMSPTTKEYRR